MNWGVFVEALLGSAGLVSRNNVFNLRARSIQLLGATQQPRREHPRHVLLLFHAKALRLQSQGGVRSQE